MSNPKPLLSFSLPKTANANITIPVGETTLGEAAVSLLAEPAGVNYGFRLGGDFTFSGGTLTVRVRANDPATGPVLASLNTTVGGVSSAVGTFTAPVAVTRIFLTGTITSGSATPEVVYLDILGDAVVIPPTPTPGSTPWGGFGQEPVGDPMGSGGPLNVLAARAMDGQTIRITLSEEPIHDSAAGRYDALNPANYYVTNLTGELFGSDLGPPPSVSVVSVTHVLQGPVVGAATDSLWVVDARTDRQLVAGITYQVQVINIQSKLGGGLSSPATAALNGIVRLASIGKPRNDSDLIDFASDIGTGGFLFDDSGDLTTQGGLDSLRKRIFRRLSTVRGGFVWMPDYGLGLQLKELISPAQLQLFKTDLIQQVKREPEVVDCSASISLDAANQVLTVTLKVQTKTGNALNIQAQRLSDGSIVG